MRTAIVYLLGLYFIVSEIQFPFLVPVIFKENCYLETKQ